MRRKIYFDKGPPSISTKKCNYVSFTGWHKLKCANYSVIGGIIFYVKSNCDFVGFSDRDGLFSSLSESTDPVATLCILRRQWVAYEKLFNY